jgi:hypothetical protein
MMHSPSSSRRPRRGPFPINRTYSIWKHELGPSQTPRPVFGILTDQNSSHSTLTSSQNMRFFGAQSCGPPAERDNSERRFCSRERRREIAMITAFSGADGFEPVDPLICGRCGQQTT